MDIARCSEMEKRYPYKIPMPWLIVVSMAIGLMVSSVLLLVPGPRDHPLTARGALIIGLVAAGIAMTITITMRTWRPPILILRDDAIYFPGRPKKGWRVAFADIEKVDVHPSFLGSRTIAIKAPGRPLKAEHWWSISERMLPPGAAFDEVCNYILAKVNRKSNL